MSLKPVSIKQKNPYIGTQVESIDENVLGSNADLLNDNILDSSRDYSESHEFITPQRKGKFN